MIQPSDTQQSPISGEAPPSKEGSSKYAQEKIMLALTLVFFGGILALTFIPQPFTGAAMGLIVFLTLVAMFRFQ